jgi:hypothetical protein
MFLLRGRRLAWGSLVLLSLIVPALGCGSSSSSAARDAAAAAQIRAAQARAVARQAGLAPDVQSFLASAAGASQATYTVVYDQGSGQSTTVIARPPDRRIDVVGAAGAGSNDRIVIRDQATFVCHLDAKRWTCVSGITSAPGGPFTPDAITSTIGSLAQLSQTYEFSVATRPMLGLLARCLTASHRSGQSADPTVGDRAVICIAPSGVILRVEDSGNPLQATSYRETVPSGAFTLPARPSAPATSTSAPAGTPAPAPSP